MLSYHQMTIVTAILQSGKELEKEKKKEKKERKGERDR
jgi:hypothetical protein